MNKSRKCMSALLASVAIAGLVPTAAFAQQASDEADTDSSQIVVVGTSLRKVAPAGAMEFTVTSQDIEATSVTSSSQLMATIPQLNSFGNLQTVNSGGVQLTVNRTNIRNLPIAASSPTLILLDGHRIVGAGVKQNFPDPDVIPPMLIERVDVLTDGGSAIYGSDAVGGVINFTTKRNFDGIQAGIRQGFGDDYRSTDVNFAAGKTWDTGSAYVGYNFSRHNAVFGSSRDYIEAIDYTTGLPTSKNCDRANVTVGGQTYAVTNGTSLVLGNANLCDRSDTASFYPKETRHSVMAGFRQELSDALEFEVKGYYSSRKNLSYAGPLRGTATVLGADVPANPGFPPFVAPTPAQFRNPNYISIGGGSTATQTVDFNFAPVGGFETVPTELWSYGITPTLTWKIGGDWQMRAFYNYGQSQTTANQPSTNQTILGQRVLDGSINPYNIAASNTTAAGQAALAQVLNWTSYGIGKASISNAKATFDGPLINLPGGELRVAVGGEYLKEKFAGITTEGTNQNVLMAPLSAASRDVKSAFAEASVPVIGPEMGLSFIHSLNLSASVRYDKYSDFGSNWAPNLGVSLKPVEWINLRARWNKSFQAPSTVNLSQATSPTARAVPGFVVGFVPMLQNTLPGAPAFNGGPVVAIEGTVPVLQPQRARNYNLGFDISPPFVPGLDLHLTYFNIDYRGTIGSPPLGFGQFYGVPSFVPLYKMLPSLDDVRTFMNNAGVPTALRDNVINDIINQGGNAYVVADIRARNLGVTKIHGFDFSAEYRHEVSFGTIYAQFNSSLTQSALTSNDGTNFNPDDAGRDGTAFSSTTTLGAMVGENFRGQLTWNHRAGFNLGTPAQLGQTKVGAFDTFDLFAQYDVNRDGLPPISLSLGITNLLNTSPPIYRGTNSSFGSGYANGSTLGRVFQLGASVKF